MNSFNKLKGLAGASVVAGAGLAGLMASSARAGVKTSWTGATEGYHTFHETGKDWGHGIYFTGSRTKTSISDSVISAYSSAISEGALGRTSCAANKTTFWNCYSYTDAYDGVLGMRVNGNTFVPVTAQVVVTDYQFDAGTNVDIDTNLDASVKWDFLKNSPVARGLFSVTNKGSAPATVTVTIFGNFGSDGSTVVTNTSNGDQTVDNTDYWIVSSDSLVDGNNTDPVVVTGFGGPGSTVTTTVADLASSGDETYTFDYTFDIPAGEVRSVLVLHEMAKDLSDAAALTGRYASGNKLGGAGLLADLTNDERAQVVNYALPKASSGGSSGGSAGAAFMALLGLLGVSRLRRKH